MKSSFLRSILGCFIRNRSTWKARMPDVRLHRSLMLRSEHLSLKNVNQARHVDETFQSFLLGSRMK